MAKSRNSSGHSKSNGVAPTPRARVARWAAKGAIKTSSDMLGYMSDLMCDLADKREDPRTAAAMCNAAGKMLTTVQLQYKFAQNAGKRQRTTNFLLGT